MTISGEWLLHYAPLITLIVTFIVIPIWRLFIKHFRNHKIQLESRLELLEKQVAQGMKNDLVLMQVEIFKLSGVCFGKGYTTTVERKLVVNLIHEYYAIGGNDFVEDLEKRFLSLPVRDDV